MWSSLTHQLVRQFNDSLGINMTMKKFFIFVPVQTIKKKISRAKRVSCEPHAQQQLARDLEVERAIMGQRCRPQS